VVKGRKPECRPEDRERTLYLRVPGRLHALVSSLARASRQSVSGYAAGVLASHVGREEIRPLGDAALLSRLRACQQVLKQITPDQIRARPGDVLRASRQVKADLSELEAFLAAKKTI
jgi:hypothetical protein